MQQGYRITAYSPSTTQTTDEIELNGNIIENAQEAQRRADSFAARMNLEQRMNCRDWQGRISLIHG